LTNGKFLRGTVQRRDHIIVDSRLGSALHANLFWPGARVRGRGGRRWCGARNPFCGPPE